LALVVVAAAVAIAMGNEPTAATTGVMDEIRGEKKARNLSW